MMILLLSCFDNVFCVDHTAALGRQGVFRLAQKRFDLRAGDASRIGRGFVRLAGFDNDGRTFGASVQEPDRIGIVWRRTYGGAGSQQIILISMPFTASRCV